MADVDITKLPAAEQAHRLEDLITHLNDPQAHALDVFQKEAEFLRQPGNCKVGHEVKKTFDEDIKAGKVEANFAKSMLLVDDCQKSEFNFKF